MTALPTTRRALLAGAGALGLAGVIASCSSDQPAPVALDTPSPQERDSELTSELGLIALYSATNEAFPDLAPLASPIADQHREHARALGSEVDADRSPVTVPDSARGAIRQLIAAEERAARERQDACAVESSAERLRLLTLIAASEASHATALAAWQEAGA